MTEFNWDVTFDGEDEMILVDAGDTAVHISYEVLLEMLDRLEGE